MTRKKTGQITLHRENTVFTAGYCFFRAELPELLAGVPLLHPEERAYFETLKFDRRKTSYLLGRMAAKHAVAELMGEADLRSIWIDTGVFRFPVVKYAGGQNIQVSISHCGTLGVALAFSEMHPLGVDLEHIDEGRLPVLATQITDEEKQILAALGLPETVGFTLLWTIKEGVSKTLRTGLTMDFKILTVKSMKWAGNTIETAYRASSQYKAFSCYDKDHVLSFILPRKTKVDLGGFWEAFGEMG
ncbi:MAG: 4'-phosphopantetheinyl transferase superfamily protein [Lewinellaceae bacterium]|nr:4'-phosphopantetheinyl transferase superfamily protein [Lewinellaceae bacterium]